MNERQFWLISVIGLWIGVNVWLLAVFVGHNNLRTTVVETCAHAADVVNCLREFR